MENPAVDENLKARRKRRRAWRLAAIAFAMDAAATSNSLLNEDSTELLLEDGGLMLLEA